MVIKITYKSHGDQKYDHLGNLYNYNRSISLNGSNPVGDGCSVYNISTVIDHSLLKGLIQLTMKYL